MFVYKVIPNVYQIGQRVVIVIHTRIVPLIWQLKQKLGKIPRTEVETEKSREDRSYCNIGIINPLLEIK